MPESGTGACAGFSALAVSSGFAHWTPPVTGYQVWEGERVPWAAAGPCVKAMFFLPGRQKETGV